MRGMYSSVETTAMNRDEPVEYEYQNSSINSLSLSLFLFLTLILSPHGAKLVL